VVPSWSKVPPPGDRFDTVIPHTGSTAEPRPIMFISQLTMAILLSARRGARVAVPV
jgi:hypothetical protein